MIVMQVPLEVSECKMERIVQLYRSVNYSVKAVYCEQSLCYIPSITTLVCIDFLCNVGLYNPGIYYDYS